MSILCKIWLTGGQYEKVGVGGFCPWQATTATRTAAWLMKAALLAETAQPKISFPVKRICLHGVGRSSGSCWAQDDGIFQSIEHGDGFTQCQTTQKEQRSVYSTDVTVNSWINSALRGVYFFWFSYSFGLGNRKLKVSVWNPQNLLAEGKISQIALEHSLDRGNFRIRPNSSTSFPDLFLVFEKLSFCLNAFWKGRKKTDVWFKLIHEFSCTFSILN